MTIQLKDPQKWQETLDANPKEDNGDHNYGSVINDFAQRWAELMQGDILAYVVAPPADATPEQLATYDTDVIAAINNCADKWERVADKSLGNEGGITGFQFGCAVSLLSECWKWGEQLRRWHNLATQIGTEGERANASGGVLNPALMGVVVSEENT